MRKNDLIRKNMVESVRNERNILAMANNPFVVGLWLLHHIVHQVRGIYCVQLALQRLLLHQFVKPFSVQPLSAFGHCSSRLACCSDVTCCCIFLAGVG